MQQAGCVTLSSASPPGSLQARKQAASLDLTFTKRRDLFRAPGREAKTSRIPQVSARSGGHLHCVRWPRYRNKISTARPLPPTPALSQQTTSPRTPDAGSLAAFSSHPLRCNYPTKWRAYFLQAAVPLSQGSKAHIEKVTPRAICCCAQTPRLEDKQTLAGSPWESCILLFPACFSLSVHLFLNQTDENVGS